MANTVIDYVPAARPGSRAPHLWLGRDGEQISALDLFDTSFVLLVETEGQLRLWELSVRPEGTLPGGLRPFVSRLSDQSGSKGCV